MLFFDLPSPSVILSVFFNHLYEIVYSKVINFPSLPLTRFNYCQTSVAFKKTKCGNIFISEVR